MSLSIRARSHIFTFLLFICTTFGSLLAPNIAHAYSCETRDPFGLHFGPVSPNGGTGTSHVSVYCNSSGNSGPTLYYQICLYINSGQWGSVNGYRRLINYAGQQPEYLNYLLYSDPQHSNVLDGVAAGGEPAHYSMVVPSRPNALEGRIPVYGSVIKGQAVRAGEYQEHNISGLIRYRYDTAPFNASSDCLSGGAGGGTNSNLQSSGVYADYANSCWVVATDLNFGSIPPPASTIRETATIRVNCPPGTAWQVGLDNGQNYSGQMRRMRGANGYLSYQLFRDQEHSAVWGNDRFQNTQGGSTNTSGAAVSLTIYGEVQPQPDAAVGTYTDSIVVTLYY